MLAVRPVEQEAMETFGENTSLRKDEAATVGSAELMGSGAHKLVSDSINMASFQRTIV